MHYQEALARAEHAALRCSRTRNSMRRRQATSTHVDDCTRHKSGISSEANPSAESGMVRPLTYTISISPSKNHVREQVQSFLKEELGIDFDVSVQQTDYGLLDLDICIIPKARDGNNVTLGDKENSIILKILEKIQIHCVPSKVTAANSSSNLGDAQTPTSVSQFSRAKSAETIYTKAEKFTSPGGAID